jgi:hypothetical protein
VRLTLVFQNTAAAKILEAALLIREQCLLFGIAMSCHIFSPHVAVPLPGAVVLVLQLLEYLGQPVCFHTKLDSWRDGCCRLWMRLRMSSQYPQQIALHLEILGGSNCRDDSLPLQDLTFFDYLIGLDA